MAEKEILIRLNKIEGQIRGLKNMIQTGRNCGDILIQMSAVQSALKRTMQLILKDDAAKCLMEISSENKSGDLDDLISTVIKFMDIKTYGESDE